MILNIEKLLACQPWAKSDFWFRTVELLHELTAKSFDLVSFVRRMYFHFYFHVAYIRFESQVFLSVQDVKFKVGNLSTSRIGNFFEQLNRSNQIGLPSCQEHDSFGNKWLLSPFYNGQKRNRKDSAFQF